MIKYIIILMNMLALLVVRLFFSPDVMVKMDAPSKVKPGDEITISLTINKGSIAGVGHMKQVLPAGFGNATVVEAKSSEFKYLPEDNVIKFTWISLPADQEFTVSYKVTVDATAPNGNVDLGGKFSYVLDNEKQTFELPPQSIQVVNETMATTTTTTEPETTATTTTLPETTATTTTEPETTATSAETKVSASVTASRTIVGSPEGGMEFTVELNVHKDGMKGFARVQETLPAGLTAISLDNKGGTFSFQDQKVKIIWDNLPADEDIKVSYRVAVADNVSGPMAIMGSFSYVENDDPKKADIPSTAIIVQAKSTWVAGTNTTSVTPPETTLTNVPVPDSKVAYKIQICALSKMDRSTSYFQNKYAISNKVNMEFHEGWRKYIVGKYSMYKEARDYRESVRSKGVENPFVTAYNNGKRITVQEALMVSNQQWIR
ncbi:MAG: hypothetical protein HY841_14860 [Bacteroidetes bacterium]|nr:hypothetical protein [Bacteroidota bacterium]